MNSQYPTLFQNSSLSVEKDLQRIRSQLLLDKFYIIQAIRRGATRYRTRLSDLLQESYRMLGYQPQSQHDGLFHNAYQYYNITLSQALMNQSASLGITDEVNGILKQMMSYIMNPWDPLSLCEDILIWRYNLLTEFIRKIPAEAPHGNLTPSLCYVMLARAARYQGLPDIAQEYLNMLPTDSPSLLENLDKWKERANILLDMNCCDASVILLNWSVFQLDSLKEPQKSSIHYIKGVFFQKEQKLDDAITCFNRAVQVDLKNTKAWEAWATISYSRWCERGEVAEAKQCVNCCANYLAVNVDVYKVMPKLFHIILTCLDNQVITTHVATAIKRIPINVWLAFIPFILSYPKEAQIILFQNVLKDLIGKYPQVMFYPLHSLCLLQGMPCESTYAKPTTLYSGTIGNVVGVIGVSMNRRVRNVFVLLIGL